LDSVLGAQQKPYDRHPYLSSNKGLILQYPALNSDLNIFNQLFILFLKHI